MESMNEQPPKKVLKQDIFDFDELERQEAAAKVRARESLNSEERKFVEADSEEMGPDDQPFHRGRRT